ncbi:Phosphoserine phosphatase [Oligella ureolytica]|uniref:HAD family hydrolase n=1 Tax=Oligella ureolytica TaxID=90244 RepID=UPI000E017D63|nr:HAD family hydrolase [Oligella ureolytica]SUA58628.1 Phosphoserine phosphatase [Oligella ureolytica]
MSTTTTTTLALFDLDHTLLPIDTDYEWVEWLSRNNLAGDPAEVKRRNQEIMDKYDAGQLTIEESAAFVLSFLTMHSPFELAAYHERFMAEVVRPNITQQACDLVNQHLSNGDLCCLVSATNSFVIEPVGRAFGFPHIIGTTPEYLNGRYTGRFVGVASYKEGKITRVEEWLKSLNLTFESFNEVYFYSDSMNDLPLLEKATHAVATNPSPTLREVAVRNNWAIIDLFK